MAFRILLVVLALGLVGCGARIDMTPVPGPGDTAMVSQAGSVTATAAPPTDLAIPSVGMLVNGIMELGLQEDRTVEVPQDPHAVGWYTGAPPPGAVGPAVLIGHVDSHTGPGVFYRLAEVQTGDAVHVRRADGTVVSFVVDRVERYPKDEFPTQRVYGNTEGAELRLITCGGAFDRAERSYRDNIVVYAAAVS